MKKILLLALFLTLYVASLAAQGEARPQSNLDYGNDGSTAIASIHGFGDTLIATARQNDPGAGDGPYFLIDPATGVATNLVPPSEAITGNFFETRDRGDASREFVETNGEVYAFRNELPTAIYRYENGALVTFLDGLDLRYEDLKFLNGTAYILATDYAAGRYVLLASDGTAAGTRTLGSVPAPNGRIGEAKGQIAVSEEAVVFVAQSGSNTNYAYGYLFTEENLRAITLNGAPLQLLGPAFNFNSGIRREPDVLAQQNDKFYFSGIGGSLGTIDLSFIEIDAVSLQAVVATLPRPAGSNVNSRGALFLETGDALFVQFITQSNDQPSVIARLDETEVWMVPPSNSFYYGAISAPFLYRGQAYFLAYGFNRDNFDLVTYNFERLGSVRTFLRRVGEAEVYPSPSQFYVTYEFEGDQYFSTLANIGGGTTPASFPLGGDSFRNQGFGTFATAGESLVYLDYDREEVMTYNALTDAQPSPLNLAFPVLNEDEELFAELLGVDPASGDVLISLDEEEVVAVSPAGQTTTLDPNEDYDIPEDLFAVGGRLLIADYDEQGTLEYVNGAYRTVTYSIPERNFTGAFPGFEISQKIDDNRYLAQLPSDLEDETGVAEAVVTVSSGDLTVALQPIADGGDDFLLSTGVSPAFFRTIYREDDAAGTFESVVISVDGDVLFSVTENYRLRLVGVSDDHFFLFGRPRDQGEVLVAYPRTAPFNPVATATLPAGREVESASAVGGSLLVGLDDGGDRFYSLLDPATGQLSRITDFEIDFHRFGIGERMPMIDGRLVVPGISPAAGFELFAIDGTPGGVELLADINPGPAGSAPADLVTRDGFVFFSATGPLGDELYRVTPEGSVELLADIWPGARSGEPRDLIFEGEDLYFMARNPADGFTEAFRLPMALVSGTEVFSAVSPSVFPNPVGAGPLTVRAAEGHRISRVELFSTDGRPVLSQPFNASPLVQLPLSDFAPGHYWLRTFYANGRVSVSGVVIQR